MQELLREKQKEMEDAEAASKATVIKVMMGEVQVSTAADLAETTLKSGEDNKESKKRFQDVTDKINEQLADTEQKLSGAKSNCNPTTQHVDLDLGQHVPQIILSNYMLRYLYSPVNIFSFHQSS